MIKLEEVDKNAKYYKFVELDTAYNDGKTFILDKILVSDKSINFEANDPKDIGGFCISDYEHIFRWIIRGSYLCEVKIPEDSKIYKTESVNGIYVANKIILTNPIRINDDVVTKLYIDSKLPEISYFKALAACSIKGYIKAAERLIKDKINKLNKNLALQEFEDFCKRREKEYNIDTLNQKNVIMILNIIKAI